MKSIQILFGLIAIQQIDAICQSEGYRIMDRQNRYLKKAETAGGDYFKTTYSNPPKAGDYWWKHHYFGTTEDSRAATCFYKCDVMLTDTFFLKASAPTVGRGFLGSLSPWGGSDFLSINGGKYGFDTHTTTLEQPNDYWWVATAWWSELWGWTDDRVRQYDVESYTNNKEHAGWKILTFEYSAGRIQNLFDDGIYYWGYDKSDTDVSGNKNDPNYVNVSDDKLKMNYILTEVWKDKQNGYDYDAWVQNARWFKFEECAVNEE